MNLISFDYLTLTCSLMKAYYSFASFLPYAEIVIY